MEPILKPGGGGGAPAPVIESDTASFAGDVLEASRDAVVVVDFWAPWCGPCKQLGPALEKAVNAAGGAARLVKINIDENPELAQELRIQSIPAVFAFYQGRPVDGFIGALPESQVKSFVERLVRLTGNQPGEGAETEADLMARADAALAAGDPEAAGALYNQVLSRNSAQPAAIAGLVRCALASGDKEAARGILESVSDEIADTDEIAGARTALELAEKRPDSGRISELESRLQQDPGDHEARFELGTALFAEGRQEEGIEQLLELVRRDKNWNDQAARKELVKLFEALGPEHPLTVSGRRRLSSLLFA